MFGFGTDSGGGSGGGFSLSSLLNPFLFKGAQQNNPFLNPATSSMFGWNKGGNPMQGFLPMLLNQGGASVSAGAGPRFAGQPAPAPQSGGMFGGMNPMMMAAMMGGGGGMGGGMGLPPNVLDMLTRTGQGGVGQNVYGPQQQPSLFNRIFTRPPASGYR